MKCLHCRRENFAWARRCDHCGAAMPQSTLPAAPDVGSTPAPDQATIRAVASLRSCDCLERKGQSTWVETHFHSEVQDMESEGWKRLLELVEIAASDAREEFAPFREMPLEAQS